MNQAKAARLYLREQNAKYGETLSEVHRRDWSPEARAVASPPLRTWRSRKFFAMLYHDRAFLRLSFGRSELNGEGRWKDGLTWDDLMRLKAEAGFADRWAIEIFPPDHDVVNVANLRHLFLLDAPPPQAWLADKLSAQPANPSLTAES